MQYFIHENTFFMLNLFWGLVEVLGTDKREKH